MGYNLGNWADQLTCDICDEGPIPDPDLRPPDAYKYDNENDVPDDFWDKPPDPPDDKWDFSLPDYYPGIGFPEGGGDGIVFNFNGKW